MTPNLDYRGMDSTLYVESYELKSESGFKELMDMIYILNNDIDNIDAYVLRGCICTITYHGCKGIAYFIRLKISRRFEAKLTIATIKIKTCTVSIFDAIAKYTISLIGGFKL